MRFILLTILFLAVTCFSNSLRVQRLRCNRQNCKFGGKCSIGRYRTSKCTCHLRCRPSFRYRKSVCGSDGITYQSICELLEAQCKQQTRIAAVKYEKCYEYCPREKIANCFVRPCRFAKCPAFPKARCLDNYCGGCNAEFYYRGRRVNCNPLPTKPCATKRCPLGEICEEKNGKAVCKRPIQTCAAVLCLQGSKCVVRNGEATCKKLCNSSKDCIQQGSYCQSGSCECRRFCLAVVSPFKICGSDGRIYNSACAMDNAACEKKKKIKAVSFSLCKANVSSIPPCPMFRCLTGEFGNLLDKNGCRTCTPRKHCSDGKPPVKCRVSPCLFVKCPVHATAECETDHCDRSCTKAIFFVKSRKVDCPPTKANCATKRCPLGEICEEENGKAVCKRPIQTCAAVLCLQGSKCVVRNGEATCKKICNSSKDCTQQGSYCQSGSCECRRFCLAVVSQFKICGSDGRIYNSACAMDNAACEKNKKIKAVSLNHCKAKEIPLCTIFLCSFGSTCKVVNGKAVCEKTSIDCMCR